MEKIEMVEQFYIGDTVKVCPVDKTGDNSEILLVELQGKNVFIIKVIELSYTMFHEIKECEGRWLSRRFVSTRMVLTEKSMKWNTK